MQDQIRITKYVFLNFKREAPGVYSWSLTEALRKSKIAFTTEEVIATLEYLGRLKKDKTLVRTDAGDVTDQTVILTTESGDERRSLCCGLWRAGQGLGAILTLGFKYDNEQHQGKTKSVEIVRLYGYEEIEALLGFKKVMLNKLNQMVKLERELEGCYFVLNEVFISFIEAKALTQEDMETKLKLFLKRNHRTPFLRLCRKKNYRNQFHGVIPLLELYNYIFSTEVAKLKEFLEIASITTSSKELKIFLNVEANCQINILKSYIKALTKF
jgi:hypothetical protein